MKSDVSKGPLMMSVDITYKCQFKCLHCFNNSGSVTNNNEMNEDELLDVAEMVGEAQPNTFCFCGGEPLLKIDSIIKMAKIIRERTMNNTTVNMVTNGWLLTKDIAKKIKDADISMVQLSLDGPNAEIHDWFRNKHGSFERVINAISILRDLDIYVSISSIPHKRQINCILDTLELCRSMGVDEFRVQPLMPIGRAKDNYIDIIPDSKKYRKVALKLRQHQYDGIANKKMSVSWGDPIDHLIRFSGGSMVTPTIGINAYGGITISPYIPIEFGNVRKHKFKEYWKNGLADIWSIPIVNEITAKMQDVSSMDLEIAFPNLPRMYYETNINLDLIELGKECIAEVNMSNFNRLVALGE